MATKQKYYTLYIDESETSNNGSMPHFCMAGIIVNDKDISTIEQEINKLKANIWNNIPNSNNIILHQKNIINASKGKLDVSKFPEYQRFRANSFRKRFYANFAALFDCGKMTVIGSSLNIDYMKKCYDIKKNADEYRNETNKYLIALQFLLENYCHFLIKHNGKGRIVYEHIGEIDNERMISKFYQIKLMGSMYINKEAMSNHLLGIDFIKKTENCAGLQIADFIPNAFARDHAKFGQLDSDDTLLNKLKFYRYDGFNREQDRYGIKYMP